ncbi:hypothetical protein E2C01_101816 [Portunus trituberculatus]|uniref:Uncharacterized protein n=1 Tax=Portunus trituberculatus TaxID=210409 RepID=A0A5B7KGZ2_PORTR|nr:hypothetical protein [Portunus trituberculatus]
MQSAANTLYRSPRDTIARGPPLPAVTSPAVPQVPARPPSYLAFRLTFLPLPHPCPVTLPSFTTSFIPPLPSVPSSVVSGSDFPFLPLHSVFIITSFFLPSYFSPLLISFQHIPLLVPISPAFSFPVGFPLSYFPPVMSLLPLSLPFCSSHQHSSHSHSLACTFPSL